jgi:cytoskeletal protein CcmA (bactofilin family)
MLKKRKNHKDDFSRDFNPDPVSVEKDSAPSFGPMSKEERTIIGQHISVEGIVRGKENLVIEGSMKGSIELEKHHVTVGSNGQVEAEIHADSVTISGHLIGNIHAHGKVEITKEADFSGEIKAKRISVEDGAYLKAVIELERDAKKQGMSSSAEPAGKASSLSEKPAVNVPLESFKGK